MVLVSDRPRWILDHPGRTSLAISLSLALLALHSLPYPHASSLGPPLDTLIPFDDTIFKFSKPDSHTASSDRQDEKRRKRSEEPPPAAEAKKKWPEIQFPWPRHARYAQFHKSPGDNVTHCETSTFYIRERKEKKKRSQQCFWKCDYYRVNYCKLI